ncbi:hypothetical protein ACA910_017398 [Epithemia clementina (nom. ined.)]
MRRAVGREPHAAEARGRSIACPDKGGGGREDFSDAGGPGAQAAGKGEHVLKMIASGVGEGNPCLVMSGGEDSLELGEQAATTGNAQYHAPEFAK